MRKSSLRNSLIFSRINAISSMLNVMVTVLTDSAVLTYNSSGVQVGTITLTRAAQDVCLSERSAYVLFHDRIERFPAAGEHAQKEKT